MTSYVLRSRGTLYRVICVCDAISVSLGSFMLDVLTIAVTPLLDTDEQAYPTTAINGSAKARAPSLPTSALSSVKGSQDPRRP